MAKNTAENYNDQLEDIELEEEESEEQNWGDWKADEDDDNDEENSDSQLLCLFCDSIYGSSDELFEHCDSCHHFDFHNIQRTLSLDFYGSFKLINYVRSQVAQSQCWSCGVTYDSKQDLQHHFHETVNFLESSLPWDDEEYLKPFMQGDSLLYSFSGDDEIEDEFPTSVDKEDLTTNFDGFERICIDYENDKEKFEFECRKSLDNGAKEAAFTPQGNPNVANSLEKVVVDGFGAIEEEGLSSGEQKDNYWTTSSANIVGNDIKNVNNNYFGSYSSFDIHKEMISDKVRTDAYRQAILNNPSLLEGSVVLDVGCGTGILSLFAAQAGASRVIAVEASEKMATVATQIAKDNGLLWNGSPDKCNIKFSGVIKVVHSMVEQLDKSGHIQPLSVDVLLSEWMGYCLLYESMLSSVLFARDRWLKPGGAILPDTATMFVAGFGKGGTTTPFWENVYGFNMSCVSKELQEDAARVPIVDVVDSCDIVTDSAVLQTFDLATMKPEEMDFTAKIELNLKSDALENCHADMKPQTTWCYGLVLWFETGFTSRFCKEMPTVLSTSPHTPKTHWAQTILTFREPVAMVLSKADADRLVALGTDACPAVKLYSRISIVRATRHRSIDISMEITAIGPDGWRRSWPAQLFNLS